MLLHFEIDQEVKGCRDCVFCHGHATFYPDGRYKDVTFYCGVMDTEIKTIFPLSNMTEDDRITPPGWCPCVKVGDDEETSICNYYRQQDGRCRATRDCEWEGCNGDRSKCPHNKINLLK